MNYKTLKQFRQNKKRAKRVLETRVQDSEIYEGKQIKCFDQEKNDNKTDKQKDRRQDQDSSSSLDGAVRH